MDWTIEIAKKACNNIINLINVWYKMDTISMNSQNSKTSEPGTIIQSLLYKVAMNMLPYQILECNRYEKKYKKVI